MICCTSPRVCNCFSTFSLSLLQLLEEALHTMIDTPDLSPHVSKHTTLFSRVVAVHVAYQDCQRELLWFGRLTTHLPGILVKLSDVPHNPDRLELHLHAVQVALDNELTPPLTVQNKQNFPVWLVWMQLCQNAIDSILTLGHETKGLAATVL